MKHTIIFIGLYFTLISTFSLAQQNNTGTITESVDATSFQTKLKETPDAVLVDVRTPQEVAQGKIKGASNIDFNSDDFRKKISALDKNKTYFVYCAKGGRSSQAIDLMSSMGFKNLVNLKGGFTEWKEKGLPIEK